jgi:hypothetical protein
MKMRRLQMFGLAMLAVSSLLAASPAVTAQGATPDVTIGKKGEIHFNVPVKAGSTLLQPGMYQLQHAVEGQDHVITFKAVTMPAGYRHSNTPVAKEPSASVKCRVEALDTKVTKTSITLRTNAAGEKEVAEVRVAGESFKHLL